MRGERTHYSQEIPGAAGNYHWPVKFDKTRGFLGITQTGGKNDRNRGGERVLLSPEQVKELLKFLGITV